MEKQNITLALPKDLLRRVKHMAVERDTSVSGLLTQFLTELVEQEDGYESARRRHMALMERGFDMGTGGRVTWTRDELHER